MLSVRSGLISRTCWGSLEEGERGREERRRKIRERQRREMKEEGKKKERWEKDKGSGKIERGENWTEEDSEEESQKIGDG